MQLYTINFLIIIFCSLFYSCEFKFSPNSLDPDCSKKISIKYNKDWLKSIEKKVGYKDHFKFFITGDPQQRPSDFNKIIKLAEQNKEVDFVVVLGDFTDFGKEVEFSWGCRVLEQLNKPVFVVIGNHDSTAFGEEIWRDVIGDFNFSFNYNRVHFVAYNWNLFDILAKKRPQRIQESIDFLKEAASTVVADKYVAFSHVPAFSGEFMTLYPTWSQSLQNTLWDYNYSYSFHGHGHHYEHETGIKRVPHHMVTSSTYGYSIATIYPNSINIENCNFDNICIPAQENVRYKKVE